MHRRIDDFVDLVTRHAHAGNRTEAMHESMHEYFIEEIREHGFAGSDDDIRDIVGKDVVLNTMGLEFWLDHRQ